jgi:hypothetical protein
VPRDAVLVRLARRVQDLPLAPLGALEVPLLRREGPPPLILLAGPRSGSTLLYQTLVHALGAPYLSNLGNALHVLPLLGGTLTRRLGGGASDFRSQEGFVEGLLGPAEGLRFWSHWLGAGLALAVTTLPFAIAGALYEREKSGEGQYVDMTLNDCAVSLLFPHGANYQMSGDRPVPQGNDHPNLAPYTKFSTQGADIFVAIGNDGQFAKFVDILGAPELAKDPRFAANRDRTQHREQLAQALAPLLADTDGEAIALELMQAGVPAGPVMEAPEVLSHPHNLGRGMVVERDGYRGIGNPVKYSRTPTEVQKTPPRFGEDTRAVLAEAGYSEAEIEALIESGAALAEKPGG